MLYTAVPLALLATEPQLVARLHETLLASAGAICVAQAVRSVASHGSDAYSAFLMAVLALLLSPAMALVLVLFGAPVLMLQLETVLCGMILSVLILQPLLTLYGLEPEVWRQIASFELPLNNVYLGSCGAVVGAWFGAAPIALDWDRPWQAYPITIVLGAYAGSFVGSAVGAAFPTPRVAVLKPRKKVKAPAVKAAPAARAQAARRS